MTGEAHAKDLWKWIAVSACAVAMSLATGAVGNWWATANSLTENQVRKIVKEEIKGAKYLDSEQIREVVRQAVADSFTELSATRSMYVLDGGRKRLDELERQYVQIMATLERIEQKETNR